ncbi:MAG: hypothetical protein LBG64_02300 [Pseudomonadales bacterium]|jgi:hypothetical protein|nr:hypothetical protein [Pseudomonadales bacterium]
MRRREKFVILSVLLGVLLWVVQLVPPDLRYYAIGVFGILTYFGSALVLREDLQGFEWVTILPFPTMYSLIVSAFYFLLPDNFWSMIGILGFFSLGMYAILLSSNIFSVAKGRTIALLNAAQSISLFFAMLISLLSINTIFSSHFPYYINGLLIFLTHLPLTLTIAWSVNLESKISREIVGLSLGVTILMVQFGVILSFLPLNVWNIALLLMSLYYLLLGVMQNFLREKLFKHTVGEYALLAGFICLMLIILFPGK